ncbi:MAG: prepilin-type N-terminal cleavage/methylation domain-containing protein [Planctomycetaceae bacterium]|jgi:prepilin-type N-terminal cleavage/methylation domain-containing protein|nr:prepilin-type N-terminal cleavage/methylation domain-containing protein [Planctomycetaceae bacterium]
MKPNGYTLLEVLIASAVLVIGLSAVLGVMRSAQQKSLAAADLATAQLACQTTLNELVAQQKPFTFVQDKPIDGLPDWKVAVEIHATPQVHLRAVYILAQKYTPRGEFVGTMYQLIRWVPASRIQQVKDEGVIDETNDFENPFL